MEPIRNPLLDPRVGDVTETFNEFLNVSLIRKVLKIEGCSITFEVEGNLYSCCLTIWTSMNKQGTVVSQV